MDELMQQTPGSTWRIDHPDVHRWVRPIFGTLTNMVLAGLPAHDRRPGKSAGWWMMPAASEQRWM
jgi:hypothetical protein